MNFRELFSKLDAIIEYQDPATGANIRGLKPRDPATQQPENPQQTAQPTQAPATIPGAQPSLAPKPTIQAQQFPNQTPPAPGVAPTDPKSDVNAMARALQAVVGKTNQPQLQPTTSASIQQQQSEEPKQPNTTTGAKPGEPLEEKGPSGLGDTMAITKALRPEVVTNAWIADIKKDPKAYYSITDPAQKAAVKKALNSGDAELIRQVQAANPKAPVVPAAQNEPAKDPNAPAKDPNAPAKVEPAKEPAKVEPAKEPAKVDGKEDGKEPAKAADAEPAKKKAWAKGVLGKGVGMSGAINPEVQALQQKLIAADDKYKALLGDEGADGRYGEKTKQAVMQFQKDWNEKHPDKKIAVDGAAGGQTRPLIGSLAPAEKPAEVKPAEKPAEVKPAEVDTRTELQKQRDIVKQNELTQQQLDQAKRAVADDEFRNKYTGVDPSTLIRQTGNMQKNRFDLKAGDVDYDARGIKHVWKPDPMGGPGTWQASYDKFSDWKAEPGLGVVGNSASSEAGQKYVADRQARILNPQQAADYDRIFAKPPEAPAATNTSNAATAMAAPVAKKLPDGTVTTKDVQPALNTVPEPSAEKTKNEQLSKQLADLTSELLNEDATTLGSKWATKSAKLVPWGGNVAKVANTAISARDIADYSRKGDTVGAGIASAALAADAAGTVFPPASWASLALDGVNAGRDVYLKRTGQEYSDPDQKQVTAKESSDELTKIKHLTQYKANTK